MARRGDTSGGLGAALAGAVGFGLGVLCGLAAWEWFGGANAGAVGRVLGRLRREGDLEAEDTDALQAQILAVLRQDPVTRLMDIGAQALGEGIVELTGVAPDEETRDLARDIVRDVPGADVVVNRIVVDGGNLDESAAASS